MQGGWRAWLTSLKQKPFAYYDAFSNTAGIKLAQLGLPERIAVWKGEDKILSKDNLESVDDLLGWY